MFCEITLYNIFVWSESLSVVSDSLWPHGLYSPWNSQRQNTGVGSHSLLQGIFTTKGSSQGLLHFRRILYQLSHKESPLLKFKPLWENFCNSSPPPPLPAPNTLSKGQETQAQGMKEKHSQAAELRAKSKQWSCKGNMKPISQEPEISHILLPLLSLSFLTDKHRICCENQRGWCAGIS